MADNNQKQEEEKEKGMEIFKPSHMVDDVYDLFDLIIRYGHLRLQTMVPDCRVGKCQIGNFE